MFQSMNGFFLSSFAYTVHTLTGCDYSSNFSTKYAVQANPEKYITAIRDHEWYWQTSCRGRRLYLVQVFKKGSQTCRSLDQLRCHLYHYAKSTCLDDLPLTRNATKLHIKRAFYATHQMIYVLDRETDDISLIHVSTDLRSWATCLSYKKERGVHTISCNRFKCRPTSERCPCRENYLPCTLFCIVVVAWLPMVLIA